MRAIYVYVYMAAFSCTNNDTPHLVDANTFVRDVLFLPPFKSTLRANSTQFPKTLASIFFSLSLSLFPIQYILYF